MNAAQISIIVPAFNEAAAIAEVLATLRQAAPEAERIVVDDGSSDDTASLARTVGAVVLQHPSTRGYGASLRTGIRAATRPLVLFCDADGQHAAADVVRLIDAFGDADDMIVGARDARSHHDLTRRPGKWLLRHFTNFLAGERIPDLTSGLRIVRRAVIEKYLHLMPRGFSFSATSTFALLKSDHAIRWLPITVVKRQGHSTVRQWKHGPQTVLLMLRLTVLFDPLKVFLAVDAVLVALMLFSFALDLAAGQGFGIGEVTVALFVATLIVFLFGLVCDQVSALRREIHD